MTRPASAAEIDASWPVVPISVSPVEAVIESFWDSELRATTRWTSRDGKLAASWDACHFSFHVGVRGGEAEMARAYRLDLADWGRLRVRVRPGAGVETTLLAVVDGVEQVIAEEVADGNDEIEIIGPVSGRQLTQLTLRFSAAPGTSILPPENEEEGAAGRHGILLRWVMLERDGDAWTPPQEPFAGMTAPGDVVAFRPGLGLVFGEDELRRMRRSVAMPEFEDVWRRDIERAEEQFALDPASVIRPYSLYATTRYGRPWDEDIDTGDDGLLLALVGLIARNERYMRQAARHALALAHIDEWAEGVVDRFPAGGWRHAGFAPNVATIKASLLLDWTWHWLTPEGRAFIREAIREKGLRWLQGQEERMANQGVRFTKGLILGRMAVAEDLADAELRAAVRGYVDKMNRKLETVTRSDGTFSEGMGYGKGTMASLPVTYCAASRCLSRPVRELVSDRFLPAMRFILAAEREIAPAFAAFCAGPLEDTLFADLCVPTSAMAGHEGPEYQPTSGNACEYVFYGLIPVWAPEIRPIAGAPRLPAFSAFREGGWVFIGGDDPEAPRLSFESGLWDGHGHSWYHKHALALDAWGERLLLTRQHLGYQDARSRYTMSTRLYNTFAPAARDQDATGTPGRGAVLAVAEDCGRVAVVESDNATAWTQNVTRAVRRVLFVRPGVILVQDDVELDAPETGVQSWNSLGEWRVVEGQTCVTRVGDVAGRLRCLSQQAVELEVGEDSVHRKAEEKEVPVYRAAFTAPSADRHHLLTVIEALPPEGNGEEARVEILDEEHPLVEVRHGEVSVRIVEGPVAGDRLWGCTADGELVFAVREGGELTAAGAFGGKELVSPIGRVNGDGFLSVGIRET